MSMAYHIGLTGPARTTATRTHRASMKRQSGPKIAELGRDHLRGGHVALEGAHVAREAVHPGAAAHVDEHGAVAAAHRDLGTHAVAPEPVDLALLERLRHGQAEIDALADEGARHRRDGDALALRIVSGLDQQAPQPHIDPRRRTDGAALEDREIAAPCAEVAMHDQEPVHALALCA